MGNFGYKKYMKKDIKQGSPLFRIFIMSFVGMLLFFTFIIKSFSPTVDTTIGEYQQEFPSDIQEEQKIVDNRLSEIQNEDQGRSFADLMAKADDIQKETVKRDVQAVVPEPQIQQEPEKTVAQDVVYKVFVGNYTSVEQAKVAKEIIQESGSGLNPIVKCIGANNYTLQVGIFKNKQSAESLLYTVQQNNLPGRIVQDY